MNSSPEVKRRHYLKHKDTILSKRKERYASNPEHYRQKQRQYVEQSPEKFLGALLRQISKRNRTKPVYTKAGKKYAPIVGAKTIVTIDFAHVWNLWALQNGQCAITFLPMTHRYDETTTISIDRIDSSEGYVPGNVQLVCQSANLMKSERSNIEARRFILQAAARLFATKMMHPFITSRGVVDGEVGPLADPSSPSYDWAKTGEFEQLRETVYLAHGKDLHQKNAERLRRERELYPPNDDEDGNQ